MLFSITSFGGEAQNNKNVYSLKGIEITSYISEDNSVIIENIVDFFYERNLLLSQNEEAFKVVILESYVNKIKVWRKKGSLALSVSFDDGNSIRYKCHQRAANAKMECHKLLF